MLTPPDLHPISSHDDDGRLDDLEVVKVLLVVVVLPPLLLLLLPLLPPLLLLLLLLPPLLLLLPLLIYIYLDFGREAAGVLSLARGAG